MERIKQHYMIKAEMGEVHPLFRLKFLPENLASLAETIVFLIEWLLGLILVLGLLVKIFVRNPADSLLVYILNSVLAHFFAIFGAENNLTSNAVFLIIFLAVYYLSRTYFEHVKYNLHMLRMHGESMQGKRSNE